jgi:hypothetical protein
MFAGAHTIGLILISNLYNPDGRKKRWSTEAVEPGQAEISCHLTTSAVTTTGRAEAKWSLEGLLYREINLHPKDGYNLQFIMTVHNVTTCSIIGYGVTLYGLYYYPAAMQMHLQVLLYLFD